MTTLAMALVAQGGALMTDDTARLTIAPVRTLAYAPALVAATESRN